MSDDPRSIIPRYDKALGCEECGNPISDADLCTCDDIDLTVPPSIALAMVIQEIVEGGGPHVWAHVENECAHALRKARDDAR